MGMDELTDINVKQLPIWVANALDRDAARQKRSRAAHIRYLLELEAERIERLEKSDAATQPANGSKKVAA